jgi:limonene-1,2-epoxide hydrolase
MVITRSSFDDLAESTLQLSKLIGKLRTIKRDTRAVPVVGSLKVKDQSMVAWREEMDYKCSKVKLLRSMIHKGH